MGFRERLLLSLLTLALGAVGLQLLVGYWTFSSSVNHDMRNDLHKYATLVESALDLEGPEPLLNPSKLPSTTEFQGRFRLIQADRVVLEGGGLFPENNPNWLTLRKALANSYALEVALNQAEHNRVLQEYLRTGWLTLLFSGGLAIGIAWLLRAYLIHPLQRLQEASESLAMQRFPKPLPVSSSDEIGRLTHSFNRMAHKLRLALEREKSFTRYASHELRNPLANLKTSVSAVRSGAMQPEELLPVLDRNLERMDQILSGLLALARGPGELSQIDMPSFLQQTVEQLLTSPDRQIHLVAEAGRLQAPPEALEAAIHNLLDNAFKHGSNQVWLHFYRDPPRLVVRDFGNGVPPQALERLGEPFLRINPRKEGLGLGLAFVRQVIESMGGRLELRNHPEGGLEAVLIFSGGTHA